MDIKQQFKKKPLATIGAIIGIGTGIITIIAGASMGLDKLGDYVVSRAELKAAEERVIEQIHNEAVITRNVIVGEIEVRKSSLLHELEHTNDAGKIATILEDIDVLNKRLDMIRGIGR